MQTITKKQFKSLHNQLSLVAAVWKNKEVAVEAVAKHFLVNDRVSVKPVTRIDLTKESTCYVDEDFYYVESVYKDSNQYNTVIYLKSDSPLAG